MVRYEHLHFDSLEEMIARCDECLKRGGDGVFEHGLNNRDWVGRYFGSWADVVAAVRSPWPEGAETLERLVTELGDLDLPRPVSRRRRVRPSEDDGDEVEFDRLRAGDPAYWQRPVRERAYGPQRICIVSSISTSLIVRPQDIFWRGAVSILLTNLLEQAGYDVELAAGWKVINMYGKKDPRGRVRRGTGDGLYHTLTLKPAGRPLDEGEVANALSGWCFRSLWFQTSCLLRPHQCSSSLGTPVRMHPDDPQLAEAVAGASLTATVDGVFSREAAINWIRKTIATINTEHGYVPQPP